MSLEEQLTAASGNQAKLARANKKLEADLAQAEANSRGLQNLLDDAKDRLAAMDVECCVLLEELRDMTEERDEYRRIANNLQKELAERWAGSA